MTTMREMLEAGVHFGHQTRFWNPKMAQYIFGHRNKIHIIDLEKTLPLYNEAMKHIRQLSSNGSTVLMVGSCHFMILAASSALAPYSAAPRAPICQGPSISLPTHHRGTLCGAR